MFKAMQSGAGSLSTTHAKDARDTIERLITCVLSVHTNEAYAARLVAQHVDLIVHLTADPDPATGRLRRVVSEVIEVDTGEGSRPAVTDLFRPGPDGRAVAGRPAQLPRRAHPSRVRPLPAGPRPRALGRRPRDRAARGAPVTPALAGICGSSLVGGLLLAIAGLRKVPDEGRPGGGRAATVPGFWPRCSATICPSRSAACGASCWPSPSAAAS